MEDRVYSGWSIILCDRQLVVPCMGRGGGEGVGISPNFQWLGSGQEKKWTQSDLRFCENEGPKRFKINKKGVNWI